MLLNSYNNIQYRHIGNLGISQQTYIKYIAAPIYSGIDPLCTYFIDTDIDSYVF